MEEDILKAFDLPDLANHSEMSDEELFEYNKEYLEKINYKNSENKITLGEIYMLDRRRTPFIDDGFSEETLYYIEECLRLHEYVKGLLKTEEPLYCSNSDCDYGIKEITHDDKNINIIFTRKIAEDETVVTVKNDISLSYAVMDRITFNTDKDAFFYLYSLFNELGNMSFYLSRYKKK